MVPQTAARVAQCPSYIVVMAVCGDALCENVEGSFLCLCASDLEEYDAEEGHCRPRVAGGETWEAPSLPATFHKDSGL